MHLDLIPVLTIVSCCSATTWNFRWLRKSSLAMRSKSPLRRLRLSFITLRCCTIGPFSTKGTGRMEAKSANFDPSWGVALKKESSYAFHKFPKPILIPALVISLDDYLFDDKASEAMANKHNRALLTYSSKPDHFPKQTLSSGIRIQSSCLVCTDRRGVVRER